MGRVDRGHRADWLARGRTVAAALLLAVAVALTFWTLLLRFAPDDGLEFERRSDIVGRICAGVHGGTCDSDQYARLKRSEAVPWLAGAILVVLVALVLAWSRMWLRAVALAVGVFLGVTGVKVLSAPPEPPALAVKKAAKEWVERQAFSSRVGFVEVLQGHGGFSIVAWVPKIEWSCSMAQQFAQQLARVIGARHVFVISRGLEGEILTRWSSAGAPLPQRLPRLGESYGDPVCSSR